MRHPTERKRLKVEDLQRELQQMITEAKYDYETNLALNYAHSNSNKIFKYISSIKGRESFPAKMHYINESASTDLEKAQLFNNYFHSVFLHLQVQHHLYLTHNQAVSLLMFKIFCFLILTSLTYLYLLTKPKLVALTALAQKSSNTVQGHYFI